MKNKLKSDDLVGAAFVAEACSADQKTVHNWVEKGKAPPSFRTPGRHLRFKAADVAIWLAKHGYPIPEVLSPLMPEIAGSDAGAALDLDAIEARANAATPGPWQRDRDFSDINGVDGRHLVRTYGSDHAQRSATTDFIAAARADVPALVAEVRRLRAAHLVDIGNAK